MKKSISIWSFQESDVRKCINLASKAGFQGIELALDSNGDVALDTSEEQLLLIKKEAADSGIQIHSVASGLYWDYSFTSNAEDERKRHTRLPSAR